jgi:hypothetical protein
MKKIILSLLLVSFLFSCRKSSDFLDNQSTALNETIVFTDSARTMSFLAGIYSDLGYSFSKGRWDSHGNTEQATDDAEYNYSGTGQKAVVLYNGTGSPTNFPFTEFWNTPYTNIRRVNLLLTKLSSTPLSSALQSRVKGESRFLRAWFYSQLLVSFGGIPVVGDNVFGIEDIINLPRTSFANCVDYIARDLDTAASLLPQVYPEDIDYGRITKGACLALKSRVLLYAASPLFNGGAITTDAAIAPVVSYPTYSVAHWQAAADAADAVIKTGSYSLVVDNSVPGLGFNNMFLQRVNPEYILGFYRPANRDMEVFYNPPSRGGQKNTQPTQNLVDCFPMKNGLAPLNADGTVNAASGYDPNNPYVNRDPRFGFSITYNTALYFSTTTNSKIAVFTYLNATSDGFGVGTTTGYFSRKMCDDNISANSGANTNRAWPLIRYAEILLNYAEAINETGQTALAYPKMIELRQRAGIDAGGNGLYGLKAGMTVAEMREVIRNERHIELAFEDQRWHDIRRWKIAMVVSNQFNKVMRVIKNTNGTYSYERTESIRKHNFRPEMYLLPIPDAEIRKMPAMVQNPGW